MCARARVWSIGRVCVYPNNSFRTKVTLTNGKEQAGRQQHTKACVLNACVLLAMVELMKSGRSAVAASTVNTAVC